MKGVVDMFQAYVLVSNAKNTNLIEANPYIIELNNNNLCLREINKDDANGLIYYLIEELSPKEICLFKDYITVVGVDEIIKLRRKTNRI